MGTRTVTNNADLSSFTQNGLPFGTALDFESSGTTNRRFTSYDRSSTTGLDYAVNRTYDPRQGRFTQPDPIGMSAVNLSDPQSFNMYSYVGNDPVNRVDPDGQFWGALFRFFAGFFSSMKPNIVTGSFTFGNRPPVSVSFTPNLQNIAIGFGGVGVQLRSGGLWLQELLQTPPFDIDGMRKGLRDALKKADCRDFVWDLFEAAKSRKNPLVAGGHIMTMFEAVVSQQGFTRTRPPNGGRLGNPIGRLRDNNAGVFLFGSQSHKPNILLFFDTYGAFHELMHHGGRKDDYSDMEFAFIVFNILDYRNIARVPFPLDGADSKTRKELLSTPGHLRWSRYWGTSCFRSVFRVSRGEMKLRIAAAFILTLLFTSVGDGKSWRGITPLKSTRADLERILGKPNGLGRYEFENERAYVNYSERPCDQPNDCACLVRSDTVLEIFVTLEVEMKFSELKIDRTKFKAKRDTHLLTFVSYTDDDEGIIYTVSDDEVIHITYIPAASDCRAILQNHRHGSRRKKPFTQLDPLRGWRGVIPLKSTRADVERILGPPTDKSGISYFYRSVVVQYSLRPCDSGWNVPPETVIALGIRAEPSIPLADLHLDLTKYKKVRGDPDVSDHFYFADEERGFAISVRDGMVNRYIYEPAAKDKALRCPEVDFFIHMRLKVRVQIQIHGGG